MSEIEFLYAEPVKEKHPPLNIAYLFTYLNKWSAFHQIFQYIFVTITGNRNELGPGIIVSSPITNAFNLLKSCLLSSEPSHGTYFSWTHGGTIVNSELPLTTVCPTLATAPNE